MNLSPKKFNIQLLAFYKLIVVAGRIGDRLLIIDDANEKIFDSTFEIEAATKEVLQIMSLPFQEVNVVIPHQNIDFIPSEHYDKSDLSYYLEVFEFPNDTEVQTLSVEQFGVTAVYQLDQVLLNRWTTIYPNAQLIPSFQSLFTEAANTSVSETTSCYLTILGERVELIIVKGHELLFHHDFVIDAVEDLAYFILKIKESLGHTDIDAAYCWAAASDIENKYILEGLFDDVKFIVCSEVNTEDTLPGIAEMLGVKA